MHNENSRFQKKSPIDEDQSALQTQFMNPPVPSLAPEHLDRLRELTRDYARLSKEGAGLGKVLGGGFLLLLAAIEFFGHGGRVTFLGAFAPLPLRSVLITVPLPFLWLGAREGLGRWWEARFGAVEAAAEPPGRWQRVRQVVARCLVPGLMLVGLVPLLASAQPLAWVRAALVVALASSLAALGGRLQRMGRLERMTCVALFLGPAFLLCGIQMAVEDTLLAFPALGFAAVVIGLREHAAFLRLRRDLAGAH
jgi:hypothetical protein